jgi:hypothetical protein
MYGGHTMKKRAPAAAAATETKEPAGDRLAAYNKALEAETAQKNTLAAPQGLPLERMMSASSRGGNIKVDDHALAEEHQRRTSDLAQPSSEQLLAEQRL